MVAQKFNPSLMRTSWVTDIFLNAPWMSQSYCCMHHFRTLSIFIFSIHFLYLICAALNMKGLLLIDREGLLLIKRLKIAFDSFVFHSGIIA